MVDRQLLLVDCHDSRHGFRIALRLQKIIGGFHESPQMHDPVFDRDLDLAAREPGISSQSSPNVLRGHRIRRRCFGRRRRASAEPGECRGAK